MKIPNDLRFLIDSILLIEPLYDGDWKNGIVAAHATATALVEAAPANADRYYLERAVLLIREGLEAFMLSLPKEPDIECCVDAYNAMHHYTGEQQAGCDVDE